MPYTTEPFTDADSPTLTLDDAGGAAALGLTFTDNGDMTANLDWLSNKPVAAIKFDQGESDADGNAIFADWGFKLAGDPNWSGPPNDAVLSDDPDTVNFVPISTNRANFMDADPLSFAYTLAPISETQPVRAIVTFAAPVLLDFVRFGPYPGSADNIYNKCGITVVFDDGSENVLSDDASVPAGHYIERRVYTEAPLNGVITITATDPDGQTATQDITINLLPQARVTQLTVDAFIKMSGPASATQVFTETLVNILEDPVDVTQCYTETLVNILEDPVNVTQLFTETVVKTVGQPARATQVFVEVLVKDNLL